MDLLETVRYHSAYSFKYSDRPQAKSVAFDDKIDERVKSERLHRLQDRQSAISLQDHQKSEGSVQTVMVEGESKNADGQWSGRTMSNIIVNFDGPTLSPGQEVQVMITDGLRNSLRGILI